MQGDWSLSTIFFSVPRIFVKDCICVRKNQDCLCVQKKGVKVYNMFVEKPRAKRPTLPELIPVSIALSG